MLKLPGSRTSSQQTSIQGAQVVLVLESLGSGLLAKKFFEDTLGL